MDEARPGRRAEAEDAALECRIAIDAGCRRRRRRQRERGRRIAERLPGVVERLAMHVLVAGGELGEIEQTFVLGTPGDRCLHVVEHRLEIRARHGVRG